MKKQITARLLSHISSQIENGRPLWGLIMANQHLEPNNPIRLALAAKALAKFESTQQKYKKIQATCDQLVEKGYTLSQLSARDKARVKSVSEKYTKVEYSFLQDSTEEAVERICSRRLNQLHVRTTPGRGRMIGARGLQRKSFQAMRSINQDF